MIESKELKRWAIAIAAVAGMLLGVYLFFTGELTSVKKVSVEQVITPKKVKQPQVKLKVYVTACQQLTATIPLNVGIVTQSDDMRVAKGYVENIGDVPVQFVQVQIIWKDKNDKTVDASTVFAITNDVLAPGERAKFQTSKRNYLITRCNARVTDWWVIDNDTADKDKAVKDTMDKKKSI
ncbi:MAG: hypothetical protein JKY88_16185 [Pseudomonadales bacterium]|nr:hypothetical protein [Pseudomonadales bacterium]